LAAKASVSALRSPSPSVTRQDGTPNALAANSPALIEVMTDIKQETPPWEFIAPGRG
jgi:hypothetical protein